MTPILATRAHLRPSSPGPFSAREKGSRERSSLRPALRRSCLAGAGAEDEASDNPNRDLAEDDAEEEAEQKHAVGGELVHGGSVTGMAPVREVDHFTDR